MPTSLLRPLRVLALAAGLCALLLSTSAARPAPAAAAASQLSMMMDDDLLVYRDDATRDAALTRMKSLGADTVRVTLLWSVVADKARRTKALDRRFRKLGADDPRAYPRANWDRYDRLARATRTLGLQLYFNVTGPGPSWGHAKPPKRYTKDAKWWKPKPSEYAKFVQAVGKRFSGTYKDENDGRQGIPRVSFWSLWNEPNQGGWLRPQWLGGKPVSPQLYRGLFVAGRRALASRGHGKDIILLGETAPRSVTRKTTTSAMGVRTFVNELLCGKRHKGAGCSSFKASGPLRATAWAHHPYTRRLAPDVPEPDPNSITLANFDALGTLLDAEASTHNIAKGMPLMSTEFGYETNPPDPFSGISFQLQADYISQAEAQTRADPRVLANTQFLLRDAAPVRRYKPGTKPYWGTYQSGLFTNAGAPKPGATAYAFPFYGTAGEPGRTSFFGLLRFLPGTIPAGAPERVQLQYQPPGAADWSPFGDPIAVTDPSGSFTADVAPPGAGQVRAVWSGAQGGAFASLGQAVG